MSSASRRRRRGIRGSPSAAFLTRAWMTLNGTPRNEAVCNRPMKPAMLVGGAKPVTLVKPLTVWHDGRRAHLTTFVGCVSI